MSQEPELEGYEWGDDIPIVVLNDSSSEAILKVTEERINSEGWDQKPQVCIVSMNDGIGAVEQIPLPEECYEDFVNGFHAFAIALATIIWADRNADEYPPWVESLKNDVLGPSFHAVLISVEGWTVKEPDAEKEPEKWAEYAAAAMSHGFHKHEERIEVRHTFMVSAKRELNWVMRLRDQEPQSGAGKDFPLGGRLVHITEGFVASMIALLLHRGLINQEVLNAWREGEETNE